jgi:hypothetical protein
MTTAIAPELYPQWAKLLDLLEMNVQYDRCVGAELHVTDGRTILDFLSGCGVHNAGHNHPPRGPAMRQSHVPDTAGELAGTSKRRRRWWSRCADRPVCRWRGGSGRRPGNIGRAVDRSAGAGSRSHEYLRLLILASLPLSLAAADLDAGYLNWSGAQANKQEGIAKLRLTAEKGDLLQPYARMLLLDGLVREFPHNRLYAAELARVKGQ